MSWLVTGGAGYIGAHIVRALAAANMRPLVIDDLSSGHASFVPPGVPFVKGTILDSELVKETLRTHKVTGVIHVAGYKYAGVSVLRPLHTYQQNVEATRILLDAMRATDVPNIVFSSSAAVYGTPNVALVTEDTPKAPTSPYGESKLIGEWLLRDQGIATAETSHPLRHTSLRYFNVVGSADPSVTDTSPHNLFPLVFAAISAGRTPRINGDNYNTPDGTNVRDYVHVADIALAHVAAADRLDARLPIEPAYNLGSGSGLSVRQIMDAMSQITGIPFIPTITSRRPGDPDQIVASGALAARDLGWAMRHSVQDMVRSGWNAARTRNAAQPPATVQ
jgi:UDP-glucose 4-epimerase